MHKASLGEACEKCHNDRGWKSSNFDHDRDTKFALRGKHKPAKCNACHRGASREKLATDCVSCHDKDDVHNEGLGPKCATCHDEKSWKESRFDHDRDTKYALKGKHANAKCATCHAKDAGTRRRPPASNATGRTMRTRGAWARNARTAMPSGRGRRLRSTTRARASR